MASGCGNYTIIIIVSNFGVVLAKFKLSDLNAQYHRRTGINLDWRVYNLCRIHRITKVYHYNMVKCMHVWWTL